MKINQKIELFILYVSTLYACHHQESLYQKETHKIKQFCNETCKQNCKNLNLIKKMEVFVLDVSALYVCHHQESLY